MIVGRLYALKSMPVRSRTRSRNWASSRSSSSSGGAVDVVTSSVSSSPMRSALATKSTSVGGRARGMDGLCGGLRVLDDDRPAARLDLARAHGPVRAHARQDDGDQALAERVGGGGEQAVDRRRGPAATARARASTVWSVITTWWSAGTT